MILITRPNEEALSFSLELIKYNLKSQIEPILSFRVKNKDIKISKNKIFIVTSSQAVKALSKYKKKYNQLINEGEFLVVGDKVSKNLKKIGVKKIVFRCENTNKLLKELKLKKYFDRKYKFEYLCGSKINDDFLKHCKLQNISIRKNILYDTIVTQKLSNKVIEYIKDRKINVITFFSSYTANSFIKLIQPDKDAYNIVMKDTYIMCLSKRIASQIINNHKNINKSLLKWSNSPNQQSLIKAILVLREKDLIK